VQVALVLSDGVSADECEAFALVFGHVPQCRLVAVAERTGHVAGAGGGWIADTTFDDVSTADVVLVPGGLGCARSASAPALLAWLRAAEPDCRFLVASSTGTVVVAAAGLLDQRDAATHWLAGPLLETYGSSASTDRIVEVGKVITCSGTVTAMHVALIVVLRLFGPDAVAAARAGVAARQEAVERSGGSVGRRRRPGGTPRRRGRRRAAPTAAPRPANRELVAPEHIEFDEPTVTRLR
jgi:transcriptional regulator GlxA family with amidase domain